MTVSTPTPGGPRCAAVIGIPGVSTAAELQARGQGRDAIRYGVLTGRLVVVCRGVYCVGDQWRATASDPAARHAIETYAAWLRLGRRGWASGYSAALIHSLPVPDDEPRAVTLSLPQRRHGRRASTGVRRRTASVRADDVCIVRGVPTSRVPRTVADVAREHGLAAGLIVADAAARRALVTPADVADQAGSMQGWPGSRQVGAVATHLSGARESPAESVSYALFVDHDVDLRSAIRG